ncbi:hypothetical protein BDW59DRAFT_37319 [Aspergillus cavernicola]|uniref:Uncharacterized protein n=1 Tax=Aspergillus cavernicola TaxID=176166 RepID=A0ABR4IN22_9EURO
MMSWSSNGSGPTKRLVRLPLRIFFLRLPPFPLHKGPDSLSIHKEIVRAFDSVLVSSPLLLLLFLSWCPFPASSGHNPFPESRKKVAGCYLSPATPRLILSL